MPNIKNDNSSNFLNALHKYAKEQQEKINTELEEYKQREIEKAESEVLADAYILIQKETAEMQNGFASKISNFEVSEKRNLLKKRQKIVDEVFEEAKKRLIEITKSNEYPVLIKSYAKKIASVLTKKDTVIYIKEEDSSLKESITSVFEEKCSVKFSDKIRIGGIYGYNLKMGMLVDETLDSKLESQREWFADNCGMYLE